ncbi:MAG: hypothetical protein V3U57_09610 [Robiginitomaculum sp.]
MFRSALKISATIIITSTFAACGAKDAAIPAPPDTSIEPAQNKMVVLPANMTMGLAVIYPPRAKDGFGDTKIQTIGALNGLTNLLKKRNLTLGNVMGLKVVLAANSSGMVDYDGYMESYKKFFGTKIMPGEPILFISAARSLPVQGQFVLIEAQIAIPVTPMEAEDKKDTK